MTAQSGWPLPDRSIALVYAPFYNPAAQSTVSSVAIADILG